MSAADVLTRKIGPLPAWGWGAGVLAPVAVIGYLRWRKARMTKSFGESTGAVGAPLDMGSMLPGYGFGGGGAFGGGGSGSGAGGGGDASADPAKPAPGPTTPTTPTTPTKPADPVVLTPERPRGPDVYQPPPAVVGRPWSPGYTEVDQDSADRGGLYAPQPTPAATVTTNPNPLDVDLDNARRIIGSEVDRARFFRSIAEASAAGVNPAQVGAFSQGVRNIYYTTAPR